MQGVSPLLLWTKEADRAHNCAGWSREPAAGLGLGVLDNPNQPAGVRRWSAASGAFNSADPELAVGLEPESFSLQPSGECPADLTLAPWLWRFLAVVPHPVTGSTEMKPTRGYSKSPVQLAPPWNALWPKTRVTHQMLQFTAPIAPLHSCFSAEATFTVLYCFRHGDICL